MRRCLSQWGWRELSSQKLEQTATGTSFIYWCMCVQSRKFKILSLSTLCMCVNQFWLDFLISPPLPLPRAEVIRTSSWHQVDHSVFCLGRAYWYWYTINLLLLSIPQPSSCPMNKSFSYRENNSCLQRSKIDCNEQNLCSCQTPELVVCRCR